MSVVTLKDVASQSGVSIATASLVINGKGNISTEVRERVLSQAQRLGYLKNIHAAATASKRSRHVAVLVDESYEKAFEWHLIRSILIPLESILTEHEYYPILIPVTRTQSPAQIVEKVVLSGAGALFAIHFGTRELFRQLEDRGISVVILNHNKAAQEFHSVTVDFIYGTFGATEYVLRKGHRDLIYVDYERPDLPGIVFDRRAGFEKAVSHAGLDVRQTEYTIPAVSSISGIEQIVAELEPRAHSEPIAIVAHDDYLAAQIYAVLVRHGLRVPDDVSIVSPGDTLDYSLPFIPQITTFRTDFELMGTLAGQMLLRRFAGESRDVESLKVQHAVRERGSVRALVD